MKKTFLLVFAITLMLSFTVNAETIFETSASLLFDSSEMIDLSLTMELSEDIVVKGALTTVIASEIGTTNWYSVMVGYKPNITSEINFFGKAKPSVILLGGVSAVPSESVAPVLGFEARLNYENGFFIHNSVEAVPSGIVFAGINKTFFGKKHSENLSFKLGVIGVVGILPIPIGLPLGITAGLDVSF